MESACRIGTVKSSATIAIIGGGFSGTMLAVHLLRGATKPLHIKMVETSPGLGRGVAFGTHFASHVLNVPASKMSAFPDDPDHFVRKAREDGRASAIDPDSFISRKIYGQYVEHNLFEALCAAHPNVTFDRIAEEAIGIDLGSDEWAHIKFNSGCGLVADKVVLAIGNLHPADPPIADSSFYHSHRYFSRAWSDSSLRWLFPDEPILLLGAGLTCIDVICALYEQGHKGVIHVVSRRGLLPHVHKACEPAEPFLTGDDAKEGINWLFRRVRHEAEVAIAQGRDWRSVIDSIRPVTQGLWRNLRLTDKRRFIRHARPYWEAHRHRCAPAPHKLVAELIGSGQVVLHAGRVRRYIESRHCVGVEIDRRIKAETDKISVNRVINCTGPLSDYRKLQQPLMKDLMVQGAIRPDDVHQGLAVTEQGRLIDADGIPSRLLYTLGPPTKGTFWESTAVPEIRQQAFDLAQYLLSDQDAE
jgi:uncharacterized NAD(P)/FAD-binding protein YdhS